MTSIDSLLLSTRASNALKRAGLVTVQEVEAVSDVDLLDLRGLGEGGLSEIRRAIATYQSEGEQAGVRCDMDAVDIRTMGLLPRTLNALLAAGLTNARDVEATAHADLLRLRGFGRVSLRDWTRRRAVVAADLSDGTFDPVRIAAAPNLSLLRNQVVRLADLDVNQATLDALEMFGVTTCADLTSFGGDVILGLLDERAVAEITALMRTHAMTFRDTTSRDPFPRWLALLRRYVTATGDTLVPREHVTPDGHRLGRWVDRVRAEKCERALDASRAYALEQVDGWVWTTQVRRGRYARILAELTAFVAEYGHSNPPATHPLRSDLAKVHRAYSRGGLNADLVAGFETVEGWSWVSRGRGDEGPSLDFDGGLERLRAHAEKTGNASPRNCDRDESGYAVGAWVSRVRAAREDLTPEQVAAVEALPNWHWDGTAFYADQRWLTSYERALTRIDFDGRDAYERATLDGDWLYAQSTQRDSLPAHRRELLEALPYWKWHNPKRLRAAESKRVWNAWVEALRGFVAAHGRLPASHESHDGKRVGAWCAARRTEYRKGALDTRRVTELESIDGWTWTVRRGRPRRDEVAA